MEMIMVGGDDADAIKVVLQVISYLEDQAMMSSSGAGDDILFGSKGADYFYCGEGYETIIDFCTNKGDTKDQITVKLY